MNPKDPEIQVYLYTWTHDLNWLLKALEQEDEDALNYMTEEIRFICEEHKDYLKPFPQRNMCSVKHCLGCDCETLSTMLAFV